MSATPTFKTYPTNDQLAQMERDLTFHPGTVRNPKLLTPEQVVHYNQNGYITRLPALTAEEVASLRTFVDTLMAKVMAKGGQQLFGEACPHEVRGGLGLDHPSAHHGPRQGRARR